jgi:hypothetical protein
MISIDTPASETPTGKVDRWEVGGDFPWMPPPGSRCIQFPSRSVYFALGRHCVIALLEVLEPKPKRRLWIPSFFCFDVAKSWSRWFNVSFYRDDPRWPEPDWRSLSPDPCDIVIAVNYFASREADPWNDWHRRKSCILVEDHSHDPLSEWALTSQADYVFSSLRKTLPIPDGAVLWSPKKNRLPSPRMSSAVPGAKQKLSAMLWKAEYLQGAGGPELKQRYRSLLRRSEIKLDACRPVGTSSFTRKYISRGVPERWRIRRANNVRYLVRELKDWPVAGPLFSSWPEGSVPLALVLVFRSAGERDHYRSRLSSHDVYCPIHWVCGHTKFPESRDLSSRILTVPSDQRYTVVDMKKVARILLSLNSTIRNAAEYDYKGARRVRE